MSSKTFSSNYISCRIIATVLVVIMTFGCTFVLSSCNSSLTDTGSVKQNDKNTEANSEKIAFIHLEAGDAKKMIESGECILVDTRGEPQYDYEHIAGAINVPVDAEDSVITEALPDKDAAILLYCDYGGLSKQMGDRMAYDLGYTNLYEFDGLLVWDGELETTG